MKLNSLYVDGFRCLRDLTIPFEDDLTLIVGENDCGKTSLIECLKVITQGRAIEAGDFHYEADELTIRVTTDDMEFIQSWNRDDTVVTKQPLIAHPSEAHALSICKYLNDPDLDLSDTETQGEIKGLARFFGLRVATNSRMETLKGGILAKLKDPKDCVVEGVQFPEFNNIQLDGRQFEDVNSFFKEVFLKDKQSSIWSETLPGEETTLEDFVMGRVDAYAAEISQIINDEGIKDRLKVFLNDLTGVVVEPICTTRDLGINAKVKFLENGKEIDISKKGDGTRRRLTLALLEIKQDLAGVSQTEPTVYLLDEPETHLHVKAQLELMETLFKFGEQGNQIIMTSHSPFLMNAVHPKNVRLLYEKNVHSSGLRHLTEGPHENGDILRSLGVENIYLFFAKTILIVEGETEEAYIPQAYDTLYKKPLSSALVRVINATGIENIYGFTKGILELHDRSSIYVLRDNDASADLEELIASLDLPPEQQIVVGVKEFEDSFGDDLIYQSWAAHYESLGKDIPGEWTAENIARVREECIETGGKFSKKIRSLNTGGSKMTKPILGKALAKYLQPDQIPGDLLVLLAKLNGE